MTPRILSDHCMYLLKFHIVYAIELHPLGAEFNDIDSHIDPAMLGRAYRERPFNCIKQALHELVSEKRIVQREDGLWIKVMHRHLVSAVDDS